MVDAVDAPPPFVASGSDTTDASPFNSSDDVQLSGNITSEGSGEPMVSFKKNRAGDVLMGRIAQAKPSTAKVSAKDALFGELTPQPDYDAAEDVFQTLDNVEGFEFKQENASNSIKHFAPILDEAHVTDVGGVADTSSSTDVTRSNDQGQTQESSPELSLDEEFKYDMKHNERGCFVIFNQWKFDKLAQRDGTNIDAANLESTAKFLGFKAVRVFTDLTEKEITAWMEQISVADHSDYDCFVCCILTHGGEDDVLYASDDEPFKLKDLTAMFRPDNCPSLAGKPKLFFIQACRGLKFDKGVTYQKVQSDSVDCIPPPGDDQVDGIESYTIPVEADFLIGQSTVEDYYSWRSKGSGSIFIQNLCKCLRSWGHKKEIMQILTRVNHMVAYDFKSSTSDTKMNKKKQIPSVVTRLTAELYFSAEERTEPKKVERGPVQVTERTSRDQQSYVLDSESYESPTDVKTTTSAPMQCQVTKRAARDQQIYSLGSESYELPTEVKTTTSTPMECQVEQPSNIQQVDSNQNKDASLNVIARAVKNMHNDLTLKINELSSKVDSLTSGNSYK